MAKVKPEFNIVSYGIYTQWQADAKELPKIQKFTTEIPAEVDIEFGYIVHVKKGKGIKLDWSIYHPDVLDKKGNIMPPFQGEVYVANNDWLFFLGDTIWLPIEDKLGDWRIVIEYNGTVVSEKTFEITQDPLNIIDDFSLLNRKLTYRNR